MLDHFSTILGCAVVGGFTIFTPAALAHGEWEEKPFSYIAINQELSSVLKEFSYINDISIITSDKVHGRVHGRWLDMSSEDFLQKMSHLYDFDWYDDGSAIYVSSKSERSTQIVSLHGHPLSQVKGELQSMGFMDRRFDISASTTNDMAVISGPPRFVAVVQQTIQSLPAENHVVSQVAHTGRHLTLFRGSSVSDIVVH